MKKVTIAIAVVLTLILVLSTVGIASAITDGELDGEGHPHVVLLLMETESGARYRCSATLLSPTVVLTAGHCTSNFGYIEEEGDYVAMRVFYESDVQNGNNNYPFKGKNSVEAKEWYAHPLYETAPFFYHDVGVVILKQAINLDNYGELPEVNLLDNLVANTNKPKITFTAVGYGLQQINPVHIESQKIRMVAYPKLTQINVPGYVGDFSLLLSNNNSTGGTCFGDSGGPNFLRDTYIVAGVTSFGKNGNCAGTGGVFRMDKQDVLDFVTPFLE